MLKKIKAIWINRNKCKQEIEEDEFKKETSKILKKNKNILTEKQ
jgi:hypothetical protein